MWAHYAASHKGFALGFDEAHWYFRDATPGKSRLLDVEYRRTRYVLPKMEDWTPENTLPVFLYKSVDWHYEKEVRMFTRARFSAQRKVDPLRVPIYLFPFPKECLTQIIFGLFTDNDLKKRITDLVNSQYHHVEIFRAQINETTFDLDIVPEKA